VVHELLRHRYDLALGRWLGGDRSLLADRQADNNVSGFGFGVSGFVIWVSGHGHQRLRLQAYKGHKSGNATFCAGVGVVRVQGPRNPIRQRQPIHTDVAHATLSAYLCDSHL
jgi:hypothetical protein